MQNSYKDYKNLDQELKDLAESSENWYGFDETDEEAKKSSDKYISCMKKFAAMCTTSLREKKRNDFFDQRDMKS